MSGTIWSLILACCTTGGISHVGRWRRESPLLSEVFVRSPRKHDHRRCPFPLFPWHTVLGREIWMLGFVDIHLTFSGHFIWCAWGEGRQKVTKQTSPMAGQSQDVGDGVVWQPSPLNNPSPKSVTLEGLATHLLHLSIHFSSDWVPSNYLMTLPLVPLVRLRSTPLAGSVVAQVLEILSLPSWKPLPCPGFYLWIAIWWWVGIEMGTR